MFRMLTYIIKIPLYLQTLLAMVLGAFLGILLPHFAAQLGDVSSWIVTLIKWVAMPLLFFVILESVLSSEIQGRGIFSMFVICLVNGTCAVTIGLCLSNVFKPGSYLPLHDKLEGSTLKGSLLLSELGTAMSHDPKASILSGTTLAIVLAVGVGLCFLVLRFFLKPTSFDGLRSFVKWVLQGHFFVIEQIVKLVPIAVFCSVAKVVGAHGFSMAHGISIYFVSCALGMLLHVLLVYQVWIRWVAEIPLKLFWKEAKEPMVYAFGVNSSLATLPVTLKSLKKLRVSDSASRLGACVGTNLNNDGILLYEVVASLFLVQAYGIEIGIPNQLLLSMVCVSATIGVAGVPEAGIISLTLVLAVLGLPTESLPLLLTVDWVLARLRSVVNVLGDMTVSIGIDCLTAPSRTR